MTPEAARMQDEFEAECARRAEVGFAVETWLQSKTARPYRPWRPERDEAGPYAAAMAEIRAKVQ